MQLRKTTQQGDDSQAAALDRALDYCAYLQEEFMGAGLESGFVMLNVNQVSAYCWMLGDIRATLMRVESGPGRRDHNSRIAV